MPSPEVKLPSSKSIMERHAEKLGITSETWHREAYIRKEGNEWCVKSESGKNMGCYDSEAGAKKRLQQIEYFKHKGELKTEAQDKEEKECPFKMGQRVIVKDDPSFFATIINFTGEDEIVVQDSKGNILVKKHSEIKRVSEKLAKLYSKGGNELYLDEETGEFIKEAKTPIGVGDKVKYSREFLNNTGQFTGDIPFATGTVTELQPMGGITLAVIDWGNPNIPPRVNVKNLVKKDELHLEHAMSDGGHEKKAQSSMTLDEWVKLSPIKPIQRGEAIVVPDSSLINDIRPQLWNLSDYFVSSVQGGAIWLIPNSLGSEKKAQADDYWGGRFKERVPAPKVKYIYKQDPGSGFIREYQESIPLRGVIETGIAIPETSIPKDIPRCAEHGRWHCPDCRGLKEARKSQKGGVEGYRVTFKGFVFQIPVLLAEVIVDEIESGSGKPIEEIVKLYGEEPVTVALPDGRSKTKSLNEVYKQFLNELSSENVEARNTDHYNTPAELTNPDATMDDAEVQSKMTKVIKSPAIEVKPKKRILKDAPIR